MKKFYTLVLIALLWLPVSAQDEGFKWSAGAEVVSQYIWRGLNSGGLSLQPCVEIGYQGSNAGFTIGAWGNIGGTNEMSEWTQKYFGFGAKYGAEFTPELDTYIGFNVGGFSAMLTHYYYFNDKWFNLKNDFDLEELDGWAGNQLELTLQYRISDDIPLTIQWNTIVGGTDAYYAKGSKYFDLPGFAEDYFDENDKLNVDALEAAMDKEGLKKKRAFSSYVEVSYDIELTDWLTLTPTVGFTPWRSMYTDYERTFAVNNINLRLEASWEFNYTGLTVFAQPFLNLDDIKHFEYGKNFSWAIGLGLEFGNQTN